MNLCLRREAAAAAIVLLLLAAPFSGLATDIKKKQQAVASIDTHAAELTALSDQIWAFAETALHETRSSKALADYAEKQGFEVKRGVAGMPTAFIASYGQGRPIIGIVGEFDALPGISQKTVPTREPLVPGAPGHGCGHNLFGAASLGAATAIKELIAAGRLPGTVRFYGTPAEEAIGGKVYMARAGLFNDLDVCLAWHPDDRTHADTQSTQAVVSFYVEFKGKAAHAAADPWNGRSALAGLEFFTTGLNRMREFVKPSVRMHYTVVKGGDVPNVVPEFAKVWVWLRDSQRTGVDELLARVRKIAEGAALMAEVESKLTIESGDYEMLVNMTGERLAAANLSWLGPIKYSDEEQQFARAIQRSAGVPEKGMNGAIPPLEDPKPDPPGGSTDVADVSWITPVIHVSVTTAPEGVPWHAWPVVACGGMSIGHKGLVQAAKTLAATMVDLYEDPATLAAVQTEFKEKTKGTTYKPYVPDGPPPLPER